MSATNSRSLAGEISCKRVSFWRFSYCFLLSCRFYAKVFREFDVFWSQFSVNFSFRGFPFFDVNPFSINFLFNLFVLVCVHRFSAMRIRFFPSLFYDLKVNLCLAPQVLLIDPANNLYSCFLAGKFRAKYSQQFWKQGE